MQLGILHAARRNELCVSYYNNAIRVNPGMPEAYYALGYYYQETGRYNEALSTYDSMLKIAPDNAAAWYNKGYIQLLYNKNPEDAITCFSQAITYEPRYSDAYYNRGYAYELKKNIDGAEKDYRNALSIDPENKLAKAGLKRLGK
jgi:tetratricopeptide (TPR) repeat protein